MIRPTPLLTSILLVAISLSGSPPAVHAQPAQHKTPTQKNLADARKHFQSAEAAKARGEYQTAAVEYLAAYELFEDPAFFYDTAEVYRLAGDENNALVYYTKYLELAPNGQGAPAARTAADQLRRSIADKEDTAKRADDASKRKADQEAEHTPEQEAKRVADPKATRPGNGTVVRPGADVRLNTFHSTETGAGRGMRSVGLASGGAGVVAIGIGVVFGLKARSLSNQASNWETFDQKRYDQGKTDQRDMFVLTGVGAAALIAGGVLYYLGHRAAQSTDTTAVIFAPSASRSEITFTATGRF